MTDWIADAVLVVHFAFVAFVVGGLALIWIGKTLRWGWVRNFWFRIAHLGAIAFVALEAVIGVACPLTVWEYLLRGDRPNGPSFVERLIAPLIFYDLPLVDLHGAACRLRAAGRPDFLARTAGASETQREKRER